MNELMTLGVGIIAGAAEKNAAMKDKNLRDASIDEALRLQQQANILKEKQVEEAKKGRKEMSEPGLTTPQQKAEPVPLPPDGPSARDTLMKITNLRGSGKGKGVKDNFPISKPTAPGLEQRRNSIRFTPLPKHIASPPVSRSPGALK
jgi:hypothetical protein